MCVVALFISANDNFSFNLYNNAGCLVLCVCFLHIFWNSICMAAFLLYYFLFVNENWRTFLNIFFRDKSHMYVL